MTLLAIDRTELLSITGKTTAFARWRAIPVFTSTFPSRTLAPMWSVLVFIPTTALLAMGIAIGGILLPLVKLRELLS